MNVKRFYKAMDLFAKKDRKESEVCVSQKIELLNFGKESELIEVWMNKLTGYTRTVVYNKNNTYRIIN